MAHHRLRLGVNADDANWSNPQRPELTVWFDPSDADNDGQTVTLGIAAAWGAQQRFIAMTPQEAKAFASLLVKVAREVDVHELVQMADPS